MEYLSYSHRPARLSPSSVVVVFLLIFTIPYLTRQRLYLEWKTGCSALSSLLFGVGRNAKTTPHPVFFSISPEHFFVRGFIKCPPFKCAILVFHLKFFAPATCYYTESKWWWCLVYNPPLFFFLHVWCIGVLHIEEEEKKLWFDSSPLGFSQYTLGFFLRVFCTCVKKHETRSITDQKFTRDLMLGCSSFSHLPRSIPSSNADALFNNVSFTFEFKAVNI